MKVPLVSAAALLVLAAVFAAVLILRKPAEQQAPESAAEEYITVLLEDKGQIVTVSRRDYIVGCLEGMISP